MNSLFILALTSAIFISIAGMHVEAQTPIGGDISTKELELKQKELELEKAKLEQQKAQQLDVEKERVDLERQKLELEKVRRELQVKETDNKLQMALSGDILFDTNETSLKPGAKETLSKVITVLSAFPNSNVTITGYADARGSNDANSKLSRERAEAVKAWLIKQPGISSIRILTQGEGESNPVAPNDTAVGRQLNRRVEIIVAKSAVTP